MNSTDCNIRPITTHLHYLHKSFEVIGSEPAFVIIKGANDKKNEQMISHSLQNNPQSINKLTSWLSIIYIPNMFLCSLLNQTLWR